jgi:hypothetical protein
MFKTFTFKFLASLALIVAVAAFGAAEPALAKKKKMNIPGHWERSEDGGFEWVGKKSKKPMGDGPVVRDHRNGDNGGGVVVSNTAEDPIVRDHREKPVVRDHRKKMIFGIPAAN